jgi:hypothetical protein
MVPDLALAWWPVLTKQKAVNFGGVEVQILTTSCAVSKTISLCTTNSKLISRSFTLIKDSYKKILSYIQKTHHVAPSSVSLPKLSPSYLLPIFRMLTSVTAISLCAASKQALLSDVSAISVMANAQSAIPTFGPQLSSGFVMSAASETIRTSVWSVAERYV